ncbi:MAG: hypothetical protein K0U98_10435 [Deltaproteobacteria bacterium]|nr:hypothetical protein [Deltaproteobacteria bacterium]
MPESEAVPAAETALKVLLQENEHVQSAISRNTTAIHTLFGIVLPAVFGVAAFSASKGSTYLPADIAGFVLAGAVSAAWIYNCGLWVEVLKYLRYKYLVLQPRLYALGNLEGQKNFLQYLATTTEPISWLPSFLFQGVTFTLAGALSVLAIRSAEGARTGGLLLGAATFLALGFGVGVWMWSYALRVNRQIADSSPRGHQEVIGNSE